jgi:glycosyltransferase involved in cell wall biosynthesis
MHILYIHQYFATPLGVTGTRSYEFARRWVAKGHKVTMLTSIANLTKIDLSQARGLFFKRFTLDGINVFALAIPYRQQMGTLKRCLSFAAFVMTSSVIALFIKNVDVVYATSTPLTIGIPAIAAKWFRRKKFIFEVRDQWPEIPIEMGIIKNKILIKSLLRLEKIIYKNASVIVALSSGMADGIRTVLGASPYKKIAVIPNSCDTDVFSPDIDGSNVRSQRGWTNKFVLLHAGTMGKANDLNFVVRVAQKLKNYDDLLFVLLGAGGKKESLCRRISELGLKNVEVSEPVSKKNMPELFAACDVSIVIFANNPVLEHNSANKFFDSLSAGRPVLLNYSGWQRKLIEENHAGFGCTLFSVDEFAQKVLCLYRNREQLAELGRNARRIAIEKFDRDNLSSQAINVIEDIMKEGR